MKTRFFSNLAVIIKRFWPYAVILTLVFMAGRASAAEIGQRVTVGVSVTVLNTATDKNNDCQVVVVNNEEEVIC